MELPLYNASSNSSNNGDLYYYCTEHPTGPLVWGAFSAVLFLLGLPSSLAIMYELLRGYQRGSRNLSNDVFIFNLTIMDILFNTSIPLGILNYLILRIKTINPIVQFIFSFSTSGRPLFMVLMSIDWYLAVVHPITYIANKSLKNWILLSASAWVFTIAYGILMVTENFIIGTITGIITYCITLLILALCNLYILKVLKKSGPGSGDIHHIKQRAIQAITTNLVVTLFAYLPPVTVNAFKSLMPFSEIEFACNIAIPFLVWPMACSCVSPLLYVKSMGELQCRGNQK